VKLRSRTCRHGAWDSLARSNPTMGQRVYCTAPIGWPVRDYNMRGSCGDLCGYGRGLGRGSGAFCGLYPGRESCLFTIGACTWPRGHVRSMRVMCTRARR
jgi:hypothetical protein